MPDPWVEKWKILKVGIREMERQGSSLQARREKEILADGGVSDIRDTKYFSQR